MSDIQELREQIDHIDSQIIDLFKQRMDTAAQIGAYKRANHKPVLDRSRERKVLAHAADQVPEELKSYTQVLMSTLMEASRATQREAEALDSSIVDDIQRAIAESPQLFPQTAFVACQGVEGAYSQIATDRIFKHADISYFDTFEGVFRAVEQGFCDYGVLPVENSTAGSVNEVFDLMMSHDFHMIRSCRIKVDHNLLAKEGTRLEDVREIFSHEQAIAQCAHYLQSMPDARVHVVENTAVASQMVAESDRTDVAAIASRACSELYGLVPLKRSVQDRDDNYTRFACISRDLTIFPGADRSTLMLVVGNEPGALFKVLAKFYALDINIIKLESRPIPGHDFEFMFYFDVDCPVAAPEFATLMSTLGSVCEELRYLGSYSEVV
jgi:chorismate mutase/prephenate dehydratase